MPAKSLSTVANGLIESYGSTARNMIDACDAGGERVVSQLEQRWNLALIQSRTELSAETMKNASAAQFAFSAYYIKGLMMTIQGVRQVVGQLVKAAEAGVEHAAANASAFEEKADVTTLTTFSKVTAPGVRVICELASKIASNGVTTAAVKRSTAFIQSRNAT